MRNLTLQILIPKPPWQLPDLIQLSVDGILKASDMSADEAQVLAWEEKRQEPSLQPSNLKPQTYTPSAHRSDTDRAAKHWPLNQVSKYAENLVQLNNGKKLGPDPSTWRCEDSGKLHDPNP